MSCPSCQVGGRRLPSLPLGYTSKTRKDLHYKNLRTYTLFNANYNVKHIGSAKISRSHSLPLEGLYRIYYYFYVDNCYTKPIQCRIISVLRMLT